MDGIGPRDRRPRRHNLWWQQPETNQFGTDEFMRLCRMIDTEPYICLNVGSGTVEKARSWVASCNDHQDTELARMRRSNGDQRIAPESQPSLLAASRQWTAVLNETFATCTWYRDGWTKDRGIVGTATLVTHGESRLWDSDKHQ